MTRNCDFLNAQIRPFVYDKTRTVCADVRQVSRFFNILFPQTYRLKTHRGVHSLLTPLLRFTGRSRVGHDE